MEIVGEFDSTASSNVDYNTASACAVYTDHISFDMDATDMTDISEQDLQRIGYATGMQTALSVNTWQQQTMHQQQLQPQSQLYTQCLVPASAQYPVYQPLSGPSAIHHPHGDVVSHRYHQTGAEECPCHEYGYSIKASPYIVVQWVLRHICPICMMIFPDEAMLLDHTNYYNDAFPGEQHVMHVVCGWPDCTSIRVPTSAGCASATRRHFADIHFNMLLVCVHCGSPTEGRSKNHEPCSEYFQCSRYDAHHVYVIDPKFFTSDALERLTRTLNKYVSPERARSVAEIKTVVGLRLRDVVQLIARGQLLHRAQTRKGSTTSHLYRALVEKYNASRDLRRFVICHCHPSDALQSVLRAKSLGVVTPYQLQSMQSTEYDAFNGPWDEEFTDTRASSTVALCDVPGQADSVTASKALPVPDPLTDADDNSQIDSASDTECEQTQRQTVNSNTITQSKVVRVTDRHRGEIERQTHTTTTRTCTIFDNIRRMRQGNHSSFTASDHKTHRRHKSKRRSHSKAKDESACTTVAIREPDPIAHKQHGPLAVWQAWTAVSEHIKMLNEIYESDVSLDVAQQHMESLFKETKRQTLKLTAED